MLRNFSSEICITKRPGWNGITIPTECYVFNITRNLNFKTNTGYLIHRATPESKCLIDTIELEKKAFNPYFNLLLDIYFRDEKDKLDIQYFKSINRNKGKEEIEYPFYITHSNDKVYVSFIPNDDYVKEAIIEASNKCLKLLPFTPRSVLILRNDGNAIIEVMSIGTEQYESTVSTLCYGNMLDRKSIDYCVNHLDELAKADSKIRICSLFVNETCGLPYFDKDSLYIINENKTTMPQILSIVIKRLNIINDLINKERSENRRMKNSKKISDNYALFQFPVNFIHPALVCYHDSLKCIMKWFREFYPKAKIKRVVGSQFLINKSVIRELQHYVIKEREKIQEEMKLNYVAIPIPSKIYQKIFMKIQNHHKWNYISKYKVIITTKEEMNEVKEMIKNEEDSNNNDNDNDNDNDNEINLENGALCCYYTCNDPENPFLTTYPVTVFYQNGNYYTTKLCRDCLTYLFQSQLGFFIQNGAVDTEKVEGIQIKPSFIASVPCKYEKNGKECWPQIPLGLMIHALIFNDDELSLFASTWLYCIEEYTIRVLMKHRYAWCPRHPHEIFDRYSVRLFFCKKCMMEDSDYRNKAFDEQSDEFINSLKKCPRCKTSIIKNGGCNRITCGCGCNFCWICGFASYNQDEVYRHLNDVHGGFFD